MKHLLTGVAVIAALAFSAPVGAQPASPSGGNAMGVPGPNPGGPGLTPYSSGPARPTAAPPPSMSATASATAPKHHHAHAGSHGKMASHHPSRFPNLQGDSVANQLNQTKLARLQSGDFTPLRPLQHPRWGRRPGPGRELIGCLQEGERHRPGTETNQAVGKGAIERA
jgi:hypothetical protein